MKRLAKFSLFSAALLCCTFLGLSQAAADCEVQAHSQVTQPHQLIEIRHHLDTVLTNTSNQNTQITVISGAHALELINSAYSEKPNLYEWPLLCYAKNLLLNSNSKALLVQHQGEPDFIWVPQNTSNLPSWYSNPISLIANRGDIITLDAQRIDSMTDDGPSPGSRAWAEHKGDWGKYESVGTSCTCYAKTTPGSCTACTEKPRKNSNLSDFAVYAFDLQSLTNFTPSQALNLWTQPTPPN